MSRHSAQKPELSRPLALERLGEDEFRTEVSATARERAALAERFGLLALDRLSAALSVKRVGARDLIRVTGSLEADVTQTCVISLEPVPSHLDEEFTQLYTLDPAAAAAREVAIEASDEEGTPEPIGPEGLDLGEAVAQQLALALDPYPRAPGAALAAAGEPDAGEEGEGPFAALKSLKPHR